MALQPVSGGQYKVVSAAGTAVIKDTNANVQRVIISGTYVGTVELHDASATTGTSSASQIVSIGIPGANYPNAIEIGAEFKTGLVYEATGTPSMTIVYD